MRAASAPKLSSRSSEEFILPISASCRQNFGGNLRSGVRCLCFCLCAWRFMYSLYMQAGMGLPCTLRCLPKWIILFVQGPIRNVIVFRGDLGEIYARRLFLCSFSPAWSRAIELPRTAGFGSARRSPPVPDDKFVGNRETQVSQRAPGRCGVRACLNKTATRRCFGLRCWNNFRRYCSVIPVSRMSSTRITVFLQCWNPGPGSIALVPKSA